MGRHTQPPVPAATFDAQWAHSRRMGAARSTPLQQRVDEYTTARREEAAKNREEER